MRNRRFLSVLNLNNAVGCHRQNRIRISVQQLIEAGMVLATFSLRENYWEDFELRDDDVEFIYNHLLEVETPLTPEELISVLVAERIQREIQTIEQQKLDGGVVYLPKEQYDVDQKLVFPGLGWQAGIVINTRPGWNPDSGEFQVINVKLDDGEEREFAASFDMHKLNEPPDAADDKTPTPELVLMIHGDYLIEKMESDLFANSDFVRIAGRWFPRALLIDVNAGHLNLTEAVLDMAGGGPLPTSELIEQIGLTSAENQKLIEFSLDLALQEDSRFDEVGPAGEVLWYLQRLEPEAVRNTPLNLQYRVPADYDPSMLTPEMLTLVHNLDDELSEIDEASGDGDSVLVGLMFPHLRAGTLPLTARVRPFFPTAYESPRIRFILEDGDTGEEFPGWVEREKGYVYGLEEWYQERKLMPGSIVRVRRSNHPGKVIIQADSQRSQRDWVRTVLVGSDGGMVFAMLKQVVTAAYDERMAIMVPDFDALDVVWEHRREKQPPFERTLVDIVRELTKLNHQSHVHASELYAAVNLVRRCPPEPILALLASRPWFVHVGDLHFRFDDSVGD
jgi:hypothetical protein